MESVIGARLRWLWALQRGWSKLGQALGVAQSRVILSLFFLMVLVPVSWIRRWRKIDPLNRTFDRSLASYRVRARGAFDRNSMERPY